MGGSMQIIIPMSGLGKRFLDAGYTEPKPLIKVDGKPIIEHVINIFPGEENFLFVCNEKHIKENSIDEVLKSIKPSGKVFKVACNDRHGPVHAVSKIFEHIDEKDEVIVSYCDYGTIWDYKAFLKDIKDRNLDGSIAIYTGFHPHMLGTDNYAYLKEKNGLLVQIQEKKPTTSDKLKELTSNGTYYFKNGKILKTYFKKLMANHEPINHEFYVSVVYNLLVEDGLKVGYFKIDNMLQWGTPYDLETYKSWSKYFSNMIIPQKKAKNPSNTTLVLPMAGKGSRFSDQGYTLPKPFLDINGKPMITQAVDCLPESDNNVFICLKEHVDNFHISEVLKKSYTHVKIIPIEKTTEGQACTCEIGISAIGLNVEDPIQISACDNGVYYDSKKYQDLVDDKNMDIIVWAFKNNQTSKISPNSYSWMETDANNFLKHVSCKKFIYDDPLKTPAIIGTMFFRKAKYFIEGLKQNYFENTRTAGEFYVDDVLNQNIKKGLRIKVFEVENYICWGTPNDYKTYLYWQNFFNICPWHQYEIKKDITYYAK
jgi:NDP-sugar pyrophosphorylase family protein